MLRTFGTDDYIIVVSMLSSIAVLGFIIEEVKLGVGEHYGNPHQLSNFSNILYWSYYHSFTIVMGISLVKISVGFFLLRLVQGKWYKRFIIAWIVFLAAFTMACVGTLVFQCLPIKATWNFLLRLDPGTKCFSNTTYRNIGLFNGSVNIFTDFVFATLPIPMILTLQVNMRTKISLVCILSLGYFACACSLVKEVLLLNFFTDTDGLFNDAYQIWNAIELNVGIIAACLPALRPLFAFILETAAVLTGSRARSKSNVNGRYYMQEDFKMGSLPSRSTLSKNGGYNISIVGGDEEEARRQRSGTIGSAPTSKLEASISPSNSQENIIPQNGNTTYVPSEWERERFRNNGIMRTTEVLVSR